MINPYLDCGHCSNLNQRVTPALCLLGCKKHLSASSPACPQFVRVEDVRFGGMGLKKIYARRASDLRKDL